MCMRKPSRLGKKYTQCLEGVLSDTHTRLGIVHALTSQTEKSNSQDITESTLRVLPQTEYCSCHT